MARQFSTAVRNNWGDNFETTVGTAPKLQLRTGAPPANCAAADSGTLLNEMTLPTDWLSAGSGGTKSLLGTWQANSVAAGTAAHYRIKDTAGTTCHEQGTVTATGGGGDMTLDNVVIANAQQVTITAYALTMPGA